MQSTLIMLAGGHRATVKGLTPSEIQRYITERLDANDNEFCYLQPTDREENSIVVDPKQVVALIRLTVRDDVKPEQVERRIDLPVYDGQ